MSVVIPAYNAGPFIAETLESVLAQTYQDFEIIIADDGSADDTGEKVKPFLSDPRVRYAWDENGGASRARNRGMALARGEFIAFLDADDLWPKDKLEKQIVIMDAHPEIGLLCGDMAQFDEEGVWCDSWFREKGLDRVFFGGETLVPDAFEKLLDVTFIPMGTVLVRKAIVKSTGSFDESFPVSEDLDFHLRVARQYGIGWSPEVWMRRRCHGANLTGNAAAVYEADVHVRQGILKQADLSCRERSVLERSLATAMFRLGYFAWMEDRFAEAAREFKRSLRTRFAFRTLIYAAAAGLGGGAVGVLRGLRARVRLSPPRLPNAKLPVARRGH